MSDPTRHTLRIDWFDGSVIEEPTLLAPGPSAFADEDAPDPQPIINPAYTTKKLMGFKRLMDISQQEAPNITLQLSGRSSFWDLLESDLKADFIVLIVKIVAKLYDYTKTSKKSLTVKNLLSCRFLSSKFLNVLLDYLLSLPNTRISEKKLNMQFWDNLEPFYDDVLTICKGILTLNPEKEEAVTGLLAAVRDSVFGVMEEHQESFTEELFFKIDELDHEVNRFIDEVKNDHQQPLQEIKKIQTNNFRNLNIFPTKQDLLSDAAYDIYPNIINGAYSSVEHYLDVQFKLLREDCFGPLRDGISKYMKNPAKRRHENIRVHPKVRIIRTYVGNKKVGHLLDLAWNKRSGLGSVDSRKYSQSKQLMFGSLILLTNDNFESILCATVLDSSSTLLSDGYIAISFHTPVSDRIFFEVYLMVESEVFFEPYHRVLSVLQNSDLNDIPMKRYIVDVQAATNPPLYLTPETNFTLQTDSGEITYPVLDLQSWPSDETFSLDRSQMEAFQLALTREFAVIQGPPGTGKTFIGVKVATMLLQNLSLEGTPLLVICYTNHALDQFLEGILKITKNILRLGSQSKSEKIKPYTLHNLRMKTKSRYTYLYANKRNEQENLFKQMTVVQNKIEMCEKEILTYKTVKPYLQLGNANIELKTSTEDSMLHWLFGHLETNNVPLLETEDDADDWEKQFEEVDIENEKLETCFSEQWALKEVDSMLNSIKYVKDVTDDHSERQKMVDKFQTQIDRERKRLTYFKKLLVTTENTSIPTNIEGRPLSLSPEHRWRVYCKAVRCIKDKLQAEMNALQDKYNISSSEFEEVSTLVDSEAVRAARVVGVTTTTAARRHDLLQALRSPIVIVEEAAEVLEAHIVASLTHHCQHVILIGDHKQLKPTAAHYKLAKNYNLEISLFERLIRNGVHARTLTTQRRMRAEFVGLIVPTVYSRLDSHPSVCGYPNVRGMGKNLFFLQCDAFEDEGAEDSWSHKNAAEARWCVALANYLRKIAYEAQDITILATYSGQANLIKEFSKSYHGLRDVRTTVVDNYQGEESRIVILSLVRSNRDGKIGFLSAPNRICVALSRAKEGFYMFGNMAVLSLASPVWKQISDTLLSQNAIGKSLPVRCDGHPESSVLIEKWQDLESLPAR